MSESNLAATSKKRERSPNFPGISLKEAIERTEAIYKAEGRSPAAVSAVFVHWGLSARSGTGLVTMAAVRAFGLVVSDGKEVRLTKQALDILQDNREDTTERDKTIKRLALLPRIHQQVWEKYAGDIPSDATLSFHLKSEHGFTETGAAEFLKQFRATLAYAKLEDGAIIPNEAGDSGAKDDDIRGAFSLFAKSLMPPQPPKARPGMNQDSITLEAGQVILQWPAHMSMDDYDDLKSWLDLMARRAKRAVKAIAQEGDEKTSDAG